MNTLTDQQRDRILALLREGKSLRSIESETGHRRETIAAYGRRAGVLSNEPTDLNSRRLQRRTPTGDQPQMLAA
ncbi:MAG: hypothetical protein ABSE64_04315 [Vulcanimicrobiaceae bacterium]|jgi:uncharacterized protein YerC